jgi:hypothetical protein
MNKNTIDVCTNEIKKYAVKKGLELDDYFEVYISLVIIHDIIAYDLLNDLFEKKEQSLGQNINDYFNDFEVFDNADYLTREYENGYLKSLTIMPKTHEIFIEFTTYYACFDDITLNLKLFKWCKAIGFSVQEDDVEEDYMTVGLLLDSPFAR